MAYKPTTPNEIWQEVLACQKMLEERAAEVADAPDYADGTQGEAYRRRLVDIEEPLHRALVEGLAPAFKLAEKDETAQKILGNTLAHLGKTLARGKRVHRFTQTVAERRQS